MPSQFSAALESRRELADAVRQTDRILMPMLQEHSQKQKPYGMSTAIQAGEMC